MPNGKILNLDQLKTSLTAFKTWISSQITSATKDKADKSTVLAKDNTTAFTPTVDYAPSTKKYVDDSITNASKIYTATTTVAASGTSVITNPLTVALTDSAQVYQNGLLLIKGVNYNINSDGNIALIGTTADQDDTFTVVSKVNGSDVTVTAAAANITLANTGGYFDNATSVETAISKAGALLANGVGAVNYIFVTTLTESGWDSSTKKQTVTAPGISYDETAQVIHTSPWTTDTNNATAYYDSGIRATEQADNKLTFTAEELPTRDIKVIISYAEAQYKS